STEGSAVGTVWWRRFFWLYAVAAIGLAATLMPHFKDSAELVRMRNALLLEEVPAEASWTPAAIPADFPVDAVHHPRFVAVLAEHRLKVDGDDWATAQAVAKHLLAGRKRPGRAIQAG